MTKSELIEAIAARGELTPYFPSVGAAPRFEAEAEWPPLAVSGGWVQPDFVPCASNGRGLRLRPTSPSTSTSLDFELALPTGRPIRTLRVGWFSPPGPPTKLRLFLAETPTEDKDPLPGGMGGCAVIEWTGLGLAGRTVRIRLEASREGLLDYIEQGEIEQGEAR